ncbi:MAG: transcriptional regulator [Microcoleus sp. PH2017_29_MFU_D_A]|nr:MULTISPECIES: transcriptional regulator [unclassified Microcoleus]MCC3465235.1 transcriptional regulator [Microcoleus sp. PH2017_06_SFM_O_A]MCC3512118.1 transcriptional regulator [Microcoleus sp. PH2017_17_BER_D_A]MCC3582558.1 transcriptional regulator [Microcoleus sp. PH2017_30_WIL_O_A]MCC3633432.1 transcriptional regulator [Microcoleus sp. PH2017_37_MFU_D_B]TAE15964.1 MAG: transcriptional regulator [Oscillatoriales cyanobacterium]
MTLTFDSDRYSSLLSQYQPRIIKNEDENKIFLEIVESLLSRNNLTPEEDTLLELLVKLIEDFEETHYQINASTPHSRLLHLMDAKNLEPADLVGIMDTIEMATEIVNGQLEITKKQAEALGKFFHVNPSLFLFN